MARTTLAVQPILAAGTIPAYTAANVDGHFISNDGRTFVHVKNGSGSSINVTAQTPGTVDGQAIGDRVVAIAAGAEKMIGPLQPAHYNQTSGADEGKVYVDFSAVTTVTVAALSI